MKTSHILLVILLALVAGFGGAKLADKHEAALTAQSAFDRVVGTKTLRCAYAAYDPMLIIGQDKTLSGIFHDVVEEAAARLSLKVEWVEEVGYGNINSGFETGRYDAFCAGLWPAGSRAASTIFSDPVVWDPVGVWVRGNDNRFDGRMAALNDPAYKIAVIEADATVSMANALFPQAGRNMVSLNQSIAEEIAQVTTGKADALFQDYLTADRLLSRDAGALKDLSPARPVLTYALTIGYNRGESDLKNMIDVVLDDMKRDGTVSLIVKKYLGAKANLLFEQKPSYQPFQ